MAGWFTMTIAAVSRAPARVRWGWLWSPRTDLLWNFLPFWLGFPLAIALYLTRHSGSAVNEPGWAFTLGGSSLNVLGVAGVLYGPIVDAPHLWATISRTYTDADEWAQRRWLFLSSLLALLVGPALILTPYLLNLVVALPAHTLDWGFETWMFAFNVYALFHINKQHWGFVCLYKRKNGDNDARENRIDAWFFNVAIWAPYIAMWQLPWDAAPTPLQTAIYTACHAVFLTMALAYGAYQLVQWRSGSPRNGPKLAYMATVLGLYYLTFACEPRVAAFWILITSTGHCAQYHGIVWQYGTKKYASKEPEASKLPNLIFANLWLYALLGLAYGLFTLQGPGAKYVSKLAAGLMHDSVFASLLHLSDADGMALGLKLMAAFIAGVRLHHFYVDSKIWRVSKSPALSKNLALEPATLAPR
jgi:hypothetical protein